MRMQTDAKAVRWKRRSSLGSREKKEPGEPQERPQQERVKKPPPDVIWNHQKPQDIREEQETLKV